MILIQIILIIAFSFILLYALSRQNSHFVDAYKKIGVLILVVLAIASILSPSTVNTLANIVGVGRGADLLLYLTSFAFVFYIINQYIQNNKQKSELHKLARHIAIDEAKRRNKDIL